MTARAVRESPVADATLVSGGVLPGIARRVARRLQSLGRRLHIAFTLRAEGRLIRVISARDMHRKERNRYAQDP